VENGRPNCTVTLDRVDEEHLGALLQMMEFETAFMGELLDIDAFNQEGLLAPARLSPHVVVPQSRRHRGSGDNALQHAAPGCKPEARSFSECIRRSRLSTLAEHGRQKP
jgi:hypothetical protein